MRTWKYLSCLVWVYYFLFFCIEMVLIQPRLTLSLFYSVRQGGFTPNPPSPTSREVGLWEHSSVPTLLSYF